MYSQQNKTYKNQGNRFNAFRGKKQQPRLNSALFVNKAIERKEEQYQVKHQFTDFLINSQLQQNIITKGYTIPTPIQDQVIPFILEGKDVVGIANTGTGKTAAFLVPVINKLLYNPSERVLIIAPTRELAMQIYDECIVFTKGMNMLNVLAIGGASMYLQVSALRRSPRFVIGTPGRLKDLMQQGKLNLAVFKTIILDEVDRMMDMGFIHDITFLITKLPKERQSLFFSATIPQQVASLMQQFLKNPVIVSVKSQDTSETIDQDIIKLNGRKKVDVLHDLLVQEGFEKVIVFGRTKWGIEKLSKMLIDRGFKATAIHGNKSQGQRQRALEQFKKGQVGILLATDVASRGLDIDDVTHVINYDQPVSYEDYIHRIGRTGRANKKGMALTFVE